MVEVVKMVEAMLMVILQAQDVKTQAQDDEVESQEYSIHIINRHFTHVGRASLEALPRIGENLVLHLTEVE